MIILISLKAFEATFVNSVEEKVVLVHELPLVWVTTITPSTVSFPTITQSIEE
jgi:hypothetical protein